MKLAWLCYVNMVWTDEVEVEIVFEEPSYISHRYSKIVPIVYAEIVNNSN